MQIEKFQIKIEKVSYNKYRKKDKKTNTLTKMNDTARHIIFSGYVQGVGFRFTTHRIANRYGLTGFVRNLPDGSVEMLAQGKAEDIDNCIRDIEKSFTSYIREKKIEEIPPNPRYPDFKITF